MRQSLGIKRNQSPMRATTEMKCKCAVLNARVRVQRVYTVGFHLHVVLGRFQTIGAENRSGIAKD